MAQFLSEVDATLVRLASEITFLGGMVQELRKENETLQRMQDSLRVNQEKMEKENAELRKIIESLPREGTSRDAKALKRGNKRD